MIVVGVDFSEGSAAAAAVALQMATTRREAVCLIHVRAPGGLAERIGPEWDEWCEPFGLRAGDIEVCTGIPWIELVRAAGEKNASFLVTGTHGATGLQPLRLGTTAALVALRSPTPVVLVPRMCQAA